MAGSDDPNGPLEHGVAEGEVERMAPAALVVGGSSAIVRSVQAAAACCGVEVTAAESEEDARAALVVRRFDVVLVVDGWGGSAAFVQLVARLAPTTKTMLLTESVSVDSVIDAMRRGIVDCVRFPFEPQDFGTRLLAAVERSRDDRDREARLTRLQGICKRLSRARARCSEQAKALSEDLRHARDGFAERLDEVAMIAEYRTLLRQELDLDDVLRVGVEYLVGKTGPTNAAVFLPGGDGSWSLGAYVNCDCPRGIVQPMLDRLAEDLCPELARTDELMRFEDSSEFVRSLELGHAPLEAAEIVAWPCRANGECLAVCVLYRNRAIGFADGLASVIDALRSVFAEQIATVLRVHHRAHGGWPAERADEDGEHDEWDGRAAA